MTSQNAYSSPRTLRRQLCAAFTCLVLGGVASGACNRTPDPAEFFGSGGASGGTTVGAAGSRASGGASLGGSAGAPPAAFECGAAPLVEGSFSKRRLLEASALCAEWHYCDFENAATLLRDRVVAWVEGPSDASLAGARDAWVRAMESWSRSELFQFGPAGSNSHDPYHGAGYRDRIYAWPSISRCRVEEQIANQRYLDEGVDKALITARGLFALEYLLFYPGADHACSPTSNAGKTWSTLDADDIAQRKAAYASALAEDVLALTHQLRSRWSPEDGNFRATLISAEGYDKPATDRDHEALNIVAWSFVYIERQVKDWKVAHPAGLNPAAPLDGFETPFAMQAVQALRANLRSFQRLFEGCGGDGAGVGFDDWLIAAGHGDLAADMIAAWKAAQAAADAFPPFHEATTGDFLALHASVKGLSDLIKNEFLAGAGSPLNLSPPAGVEGDND